VVLQPYIEMDNAYKLWDLTRRYAEQPVPAPGAPDPCIQTSKVYYCPSRRAPGGWSTEPAFNTAPGASLTPRPGALSDYASCAGTANNDGVMKIIESPSGIVNGVPVTGKQAFNNSGPGALLLRWRPERTFAVVTDGTSNTALMGEKFI